MIMVDVNEPEIVFEKLEEHGIPYIKTQIRVFWCKSCGKIYGLETDKTICECGNEIISDRVGDFMDSDKRWVVERKTTGDFANSVRDHSLHVQATNMARFFKGNKFVFLEGFLSVMYEDPRNEPIRNWLRSMRSTLAQYEVYLWQMDDLDMFMYELNELDKKCGSMPMIYDKINPNFKGWSQQKKIVSTLFDVSDKKADTLLKYFGSPIEIFEEILRASVLLTRTGNPKGITGKLSEIRGFGHRFVSKNKEMLLTSGE